MKFYTIILHSILRLCSLFKTFTSESNPVTQLLKDFYNKIYTSIKKEVFMVLINPLINEFKIKIFILEGKGVSRRKIFIP